MSLSAPCSISFFLFFNKMAVLQGRIYASRAMSVQRPFLWRLEVNFSNSKMNANPNANKMQIKRKCNANSSTYITLSLSIKKKEFVANSGSYLQIMKKNSQNVIIISA